MADEPDTDEILCLPDGTPIRMGCIAPDVARFAAVPAWSEKNDVIPESQWEEHDDFAHLCDPPKMQHYSNCTNASLAWLLKVAFRAAGMLDCPDLSMAYLYARNNGGRDAGAMCRDVIYDAMRYGDPPASVVPESSIYMPRGGFSQAVDDAAAQFQALEVYQCENWQDVGSALTRRFLVYQGFALGNDFINRTPSSGIVPEWDGRNSNGHAQGSRGLIKINGVWRTITPNTWGTSWGKAGVGYNPQSYFWVQRGNYVNLDCYAIRAIKVTGDQPPAAHS